MKWARISAMERKSIVLAMVVFFSFILITTAWDYCRPDPDTLLFKGDSAAHSAQIKKPHHPCASLKDAYDIFAGFMADRTRVSNFSAVSLFDLPADLLAWNSQEFYGLSPPSENFPPLELPLFLLYRNLRL